MTLRQDWRVRCQKQDGSVSSVSPIHTVVYEHHRAKMEKVNPMNKEMRMQKKKVMNLEAMLGMMVEMKNALNNVMTMNPLRIQWKMAWFTYAMFVIMVGKAQK